MSIVVHEYYDCTIYLSPIVLYEYTALQIEDVKSHLELIGSLANNFERELRKVNGKLDNFGLEKLELVNKSNFKKTFDEPWQSFVDKGIKLLTEKFGRKAVLLSWPDVAHEAIVQRCSQRIAPFHLQAASIVEKQSGRTQKQEEQGKDKGYKDYLLWLNVADLLRTCPEKVIFISNDKAFYKGKDDDSPHPHFTVEQDCLDRFTLFRTLSDFNRQYIDVFRTLAPQFVMDTKERDGDLFQAIQASLTAKKDVFVDALDSKLKSIAAIPADAVMQTEGIYLIDVYEAWKLAGAKYKADISILTNHNGESFELDAEGAVSTRTVDRVSLYFRAKAELDNSGEILTLTINADAIAIANQVSGAVWFSEPDGLGSREVRLTIHHLFGGKLPTQTQTMRNSTSELFLRDLSTGEKSLKGKIQLGRFFECIPTSVAHWSARRCTRRCIT